MPISLSLKSLLKKSFLKKRNQLILKSSEGKLNNFCLVFKVHLSKEVKYKTHVFFEGNSLLCS